MRLTPEQRVLRSITERDWLAQVLSAAALFGWRSFHPLPGWDARGRRRTFVQGDGIGWPDLILLRGARGIAVELKRELGATTPEQDAWLAAFAAAGFGAYVWRPSDREEMIAILSEGRVRAVAS